MKKIFLLILIISTYTFSNADPQKTSQLEMFLFKIGFQSLLQDVKVIKEKSNVNSEDIEHINKKIDYIITELTKSSINLELNESKENEIEKLKNIIFKLEDKITLLENSMLKMDIQPQVQTKVQHTTIKKEKVDDKSKVIISDKLLNDIEKKYNSNFSIRLGIYSQQESIDATMKKYSKIVTDPKHILYIKTCFACKNKKLKKILIDGFQNRSEAENYINTKKLKNVMIVDNNRVKL